MEAYFLIIAFCLGACATGLPLAKRNMILNRKINILKHEIESLAMKEAFMKVLKSYEKNSKNSKDNYSSEQDNC